MKGGTMANIKPITRREIFYSAAAGGAINLPTPITRREKYLAKAAGEDIKIPAPVTREEHFLQAIAESGGGDPEELYAALNATLWG